MPDMSPQPGDLVLLPPEDGLGTGVFLVTQVYSAIDVEHRGMQVMGRNGTLWPARSRGARVVSRPDHDEP